MIIVGTVVFAPEYAHEIIDWFHGNLEHATKPQVSKDNNENSNKKSNGDGNNENSNNKANEDNNIVDKSESPIQEGNAFHAPQRSNTENKGKSEPPVQKGRVVYRVPQRSNTENKEENEPPVQKGYGVHTKPSTKEQLLEWLKSEDYRVAAGQGFYRITWIYRKPSLTKPSAVIVSKDGKVTIRYEKKVIINVNDASILGQNIDVRGRNNSTVGIGTITKVDNGIIKTASMKYENGYWWVVTTYSFDWYIGRDRIEKVWLKAKEIKEINE